MLVKGVSERAGMSLEALLLFTEASIPHKCTGSNYSWVNGSKGGRKRGRAWGMQVKILL